MTRGRLLRVAGTVAALLALLVGAAAVLIMTADLRLFAERRIAAAVGRPVSVGSVAVGWGSPLRLDLGNVVVANAPWGREPEMPRIGWIRAAVDPWALLRGRLLLTGLAFEAPTLLLERDRNGSGNWKPLTRPGEQGNPAEYGSERAGIPVILDLALRDGRLVMHTSGGQRLTIDVAALAIRTAGEDQPVTLQADGAYNGTGIRLDVAMDPFAVLRDPSRPYGIDGTATGAGSRIALAGQLAKPLDFDGIDGRLAIESENLAGLAELFGLALPAGLPLAAQGHLLRSGDDWKLEALAGALAGTAIDGGLALTEGAGKAPNAFRVAITAADLDLDRLPRRPGGSGDWRAWPLPAPAEEDDRLDAVIKARRVTLGGLAVRDLSVQIATGPGRVSLAPLSLSVLGGRIDAGVTATAEGGRRHLALAVGAAGLDADHVLRLLRERGRPLTGRFDLRLDLAGTGARLGDAVGVARGHLVLAMAQGEVSRSLFRAASADILALFGDDQERLPLACLLAVAEVRDGIATVTPLRLRTREGTLFAGGRIDLARNRIDATVRSERTGFFALDLPLHVTGRLDAPSVTPQLASRTDAWKAAGVALLGRLPAALRKPASENQCAR